MAMNGAAPTCASCGGLNTNPQATQCRYCGRPLGPAPYGQPYVQPYGQPYVQPYGQPYVQPYGVPPPVYRPPSGWSTFFWVRLVIVGIAISLSLLGACVSALTHR
jgi:hypothetical protein